MPMTERDLADDAQWKVIQKNTFTRWANEHLKTANKNINNLESDLSDGLRLIALVEVLSGKKFKHVNKRPNFRTQKLENVTMVLEFLERDEGIRIVNIDSSDIVDCKLKLILGLIWTLILHYSISMPMWEGEEPTPSEGGPTPKQRLLNWVQSKVPDQPIKNFTTDWNDGRAIGALVDAVGPGLCPDWEDWNPKNAKKNAKEAMDNAEKWLDIPQLIKPEEITNPKVDELSMMTYLSQFPKAKLKPGAPVRPRLNPNRVRAYGPGLEPKGNQVGAPARFTVETFSAGKGSLEVTVLNPKGKKETCECVFNNDRNLTYSCVYVPSMEGEYKVIIKFGEREINKSPFTVKVEGAAGDPTKVTASGPGLEKTGVIATKRTYFEVFTKNAVPAELLSDIEAGKGSIDVVILDPHGRKDTIRPSIAPVPGKEGTYLVEYIAMEQGLHSINIMFAGQQIPKSPYGVNVSPASNAKMCYATGRGIQPKGVRVNENADFKVHTKGAGSAEVKVHIIGPGGVETKCTITMSKTEEGVYECVYVPLKQGQYIINITFGDQHIAKSPFKVEVGPAKTSKIRAYGPGLEGGVVNQPARFTVETQGETGALGFSIEGPSQAKIDCKDNGDGSAAEIADLLIMSGARVNTKDNKWLTPLHRACCSKSDETVETLLRHQADVNARDKNWQTPLHIAAANNAVRCAEYLIPLLTNVNVSDRAGRTSLQHASFNGHKEMTKLLLDKGATINAFDKKDRRAVHWAAYMGHTEVVRILVEHGAELNCRDKQMYTPLHAAASSGQITVVKFLLEYQVEVDAVNVHGNTALHIACLNGQDPVVTELLQFGASINSVNHRGMTPLHYAASSTHGGICLEIMVTEGANTKAQCNDGRSPLHMTAVHGRFTRAQTLLEHGADIDVCDKFGNTPLHIAARYGHELLINTLLENGSDPMKRGTSGMLPVHIAALNGHVDCVKTLLAAMVNLEIDITDDFGRTCLHGGACSGRVDVVDLLLKMGADVLCADHEGRVPLHYASAHTHGDCVASLINAGRAAVNITDRRGCTPLHYASAWDHDAKVVELLLKNDARPSIRDHDGFNTLHYAAMKGHRLTLEMLLDCASTDLIRSGAPLSPAHIAAYNGHNEALHILLGCIMNLDIRDSHGRTMLDLACLQGHGECVETLLLQGATILVQDSTTRRTPLHSAAMNGHTECLRLLMETAEDSNIVDCTDVYDRTPLMMAVANGHVDTVLYLIANGAIVNAKDSQGRTSLHRGAANGHEECVDALLHNGADVNVRDQRGRVATYLAATCGQVSILSNLLAMGPNSSKTEDQLGYTPLHIACYNGQDNCVETIIEQDKITEFSGNPFSPLHCAVINGNDTCTEILLEAFGDKIVNLTDGKGRTPLHAAAFSDQCESMQMLLNHGALVNHCDTTGKSPIMLAAANGHAAAVELLLEQNADLSLTDNEGNTCLHFACSREHENVALLLLDKIHDSNICNIANSELKTPLHIAARYGLTPVVQDLITKGSSVYALDENGHTPALACAPNNRVADCLAIILAHMPLSPTPNNVYPRTGRYDSSTPNNTFAGTRTLEPTGDQISIGSPSSSVQDVKEHSGSYQSSDSEFY